MSETTPTPPPEPAAAHLNAAGDVTVGGHVVGRDLVTVNNTVTVTLSGDLLAQLEQIKALSTELHKAPAGRPAPASAAPVKATEALKGVDTALELLQQPAGAPAQELQAGGLQISRGELLLKKAILLEAEAEEYHFEATLRAGNQTDEAGRHLLPDDYDDAPRLAKLRAAENLLREILQLDPANTEALARLALVLSELSPDDPGESLKLLNRVQVLLSTPQNDAEKFRLAQARYFLAINQSPLNEAGLAEARSLFEALGRAEWVAMVDEDLAAAEGGAEFEPLGPWIIEVNNAEQTVIQVELQADGQCAGTVQERPKGRSKKISRTDFSGQWGYDMDRHIFSLEGVYGQQAGFALEVQLTGADEVGFHAVDREGGEYILSRPADG